MVCFIKYEFSIYSQASITWWWARIELKMLITEWNLQFKKTNNFRL